MRVTNVAVILGLLGLAASAQAQTDRPREQRALLDKYCVTCHNQRLKTAGLMLDRADVGDIPSGAEIWEKVIRKVRGEAMPPLGAARPDRAALKGLVSWLQS